MKSNGTMDHELGPWSLSSHTALPPTTSLLLGSSSQPLAPLLPGTTAPQGFPLPTPTQQLLPTYPQPGHRHRKDQGRACAHQSIWRGEAHNGSSPLPRLAHSVEDRVGISLQPTRARSLVYLVHPGSKAAVPLGLPIF